MSEEQIHATTKVVQLVVSPADHQHHIEPSVDEIHAFHAAVTISVSPTRQQVFVEV